MKSQYNLKIDFPMIPDVLFNEHNMKTKLNDYMQIFQAFLEANAFKILKLKVPKRKEIIVNN